MGEGFDQRGLSIRVVTTEAAEGDIAVMDLPPRKVDAIARSLREIGHSHDDEAVGPMVVRRIGDLEVGYTRTTDGSTYILTVFAVRPVQPQAPMARMLKGMEVVAMLRRVTGL